MHIITESYKFKTCFKNDSLQTEIYIKARKILFLLYFSKHKNTECSYKEKS
jgi:hypothetical protein